MLSVQTHCAILENNQVEGFVEPPVMKTTERGEEVQFMVLGLQVTMGQRSASALPVVAFAVKEALGVAVQRLDRVVRVIALLRVIQGHEEG